MKTIVIITFMLLAVLSATFGQTPADSIVIKKVSWGYRFYQGGESLRMNQLVNAMKANDLAYKQIKSAHTAYNVASVFSFAGGCVIGYPLGTAIAGGDPNWTLAAAGVGLVLISIFLNQSFNKKAAQAVDIFNTGLSTSSFRDNRELLLSLTENGAGITFKF